MSSKIEEYKSYLKNLDLSEQEKEDLIGSIQCITESILDKKYMLGLTDETTQKDAY